MKFKDRYKRLCSGWHVFYRYTLWSGRDHLLHIATGIFVEEYKRFEKLLPLAYEFVALAARSKAVRETVVVYFERYTQILATIIQQGIDRGEFHPCDPEMTATSLIAMYEGIAMLWFIEPSLVDWDVMMHEPIELILSGLVRKVG